MEEKFHEFLILSKDSLHQLTLHFSHSHCGDRLHSVYSVDLTHTA